MFAVGAVYVYLFIDSGETWSEVAKLMAADGEADDRFGYALAIYNNTIVASAALDDNAKGTDAGNIV